MKYLKSLLIPSLLFLISFVMRMALIGKGSYCTDALYLALNAQLTLDTLQIHYLQGPGLPLTAVLGALMTGLTKFMGADDPIFAVNLMSVFLSSLSVPLFYLIVKHIFDKTTALIASLLLCFYSLFLAVSVFGNSHTPAILFFLAGFYFLLRYKNFNTRPDFLFSAVAFGLMGAARLQDFIPTIASIAYAFFIDVNAPAGELSRLKNNKNLLKSLIGFILLTATVVLIFYIPLLQETWIKRSPNGSLTSYWNSAWANIQKFSPTNIIDVVIFLFSSQFPLGCFASILGLILILKNDIKKFSLLLFWFFPIILFLGTIWIQLPRYFIIPALALLIAQGYLYSAFFNFSPPWKCLSLLLIFISLIMNFSFIYPKIQFRHRHTLIEDYYAWVGDTTEADAHILERDHSRYIHHFSHRQSVPNPLSDLSYNREEALLIIKNHIDTLLTEGKPVYATKTGLTGYANGSEIAGFILSHYELIPVGNHSMEEWHKDVLIQTIMDNPLYKIERK